MLNHVNITARRFVITVTATRLTLNAKGGYFLVKDAAGRLYRIATYSKPVKFSKKIATLAVPGRVGYTHEHFVISTPSWPTQEMIDEMGEFNTLTSPSYIIDKNTRYWSRKDEEAESRWLPNKYIIRFISTYSETLGHMDDIVAYVDSETTLATVSSTLDGFTFTGWRDALNKDAILKLYGLTATYSEADLARQNLLHGYGSDPNISVIDNVADYGITKVTIEDLAARDEEFISIDGATLAELIALGKELEILDKSVTEANISTESALMLRNAIYDGIISRGQKKGYADKAKVNNIRTASNSIAFLIASWSENRYNIRFNLAKPNFKNSYEKVIVGKMATQSLLYTEQKNLNNVEFDIRGYRLKYWFARLATSSDSAKNGMKNKKFTKIPADLLELLNNQPSVPTKSEPGYYFATFANAEKITRLGAKYDDGEIIDLYAIWESSQRIITYVATNSTTIKLKKGNDNHPWT